MVIREFHVEGIARLEAETQAPLIVDPNTILPFAVTFQSFQPIARRHPQVINTGCVIQGVEAAYRACRKFGVNAFALLRQIKRARAFVRKRFNQAGDPRE